MIQELMTRLCKLQDENIAIKVDNNYKELARQNLVMKLKVAAEKIIELECELGNLKLDLNREAKNQNKSPEAECFDEYLLNFVLAGADAGKSEEKPKLPAPGSKWVKIEDPCGVVYTVRANSDGEKIRLGRVDSDGYRDWVIPVEFLEDFYKLWKPACRALEIGEVIEEGDEYLYKGSWVKAVQFGTGVGSIHNAPHRRHIK